MIVFDFLLTRVVMQAVTDKEMGRWGFVITSIDLIGTWQDVGLEYTDDRMEHMVEIHYFIDLCG